MRIVLRQMALISLKVAALIITVLLCDYENSLSICKSLT